jgi:hypothetical protein
MSNNQSCNQHPEIMQVPNHNGAFMAMACYQSWCKIGGIK